MGHIRDIFRRLSYLLGARDREIVRLQQQVSRLTDWLDERGIELRESQDLAERLNDEIDVCLRYSFEATERKGRER